MSQKPRFAERFRSAAGHSQSNGNRFRALLFGHGAALASNRIMLTLDDLKRFAAVSGHCLTVYEPLRHDGARAGGDLPRVRKTGSPGSAAIREVEQILADNGWDEASRHDTLRSLRKAGGGFPSSTSISEKGSVIVFRARDFSHATFWPETLAPRIHFGSQFLVLPLLPAIANDRCFWILTLSAKGPHLFRGSPEKLIEVRLPYNVPKSPADTDGFFGPGSSSDAGLSNFFRGIDRGIRPVLMNERYPLLLAGVTQELSLYGGVNTYAPILRAGYTWLPGTSDTGSASCQGRGADSRVRGGRARQSVARPGRRGSQGPSRHRCRRNPRVRRTRARGASDARFSHFLLRDAPRGRVAELGHASYHPACGHGFRSRPRAPSLRSGGDPPLSRPLTGSAGRGSVQRRRAMICRSAASEMGLVRYSVNPASSPFCRSPFMAVAVTARIGMN